MLQRLFTWTIIAAIWKRYGRALKILPLLLVGIFIISLIHDDYIQYAEVSNDKSLLRWSFLIKWFLIISVVVWYWRFASDVMSGKKNRQTEVDAGNYGERKSRATQSNGDSAATSDQSPDPFSEIRTKKKLRSKADMVIERDRDS